MIRSYYTLTRLVTDNNEWFEITGVLVTYENVLYLSAMSVGPQLSTSSMYVRTQKYVHLTKEYMAKQLNRLVMYYY